MTATTTSIGGLGGTLSSSFDADGNRTLLTHPDGFSFVSTYDATDRLQYTNMTPPGSSSQVRFLTYIYDALGRPTTINPASSFRYEAYDPVSRPSSLSWTFAGGVGNVTDTLGYNPASQIASEARTNDAFVWRGGVATTRAYAVNGLNQYTTAGPASFGYDADGNLISDGASTYGYDAENRLISATGAANAGLVYDPLGRLWQTSSPSTTTTAFLHDGDQIALEYGVSGNVLRRYMWGSGADAPVIWDEGALFNCSATRALSADHQGSIVATADCWGNQNAVDTYDEYGIPGAANVGRFQYTGQAWIPELGMYYYKARIYSPTLGRFMQTDPIGYKDQVNLYEYVGDDPVDGSDPTGEASSVPNNGGFGEWMEAINPLNIVVTFQAVDPAPAPAPQAAGQPVGATTVPKGGNETLGKTAGIIAAETLSVKDGPNGTIADAQSLLAHQRINAERAYGRNINRLAGEMAPITSGSAYDAALGPTTRAAMEDARGIDPTNGATNYNMRTESENKAMGDRAPSFLRGMVVHTRSGPFPTWKGPQYILTYGPPQ